MLPKGPFHTFIMLSIAEIGSSKMEEYSLKRIEISQLDRHYHIFDIFDIVYENAPLG